MSSVGVVVIGRNEGRRLHRCLTALVARPEHIVYVDSGSQDGSVELARSLGVEVVELDTATRFTASRARNAGFAHLLAADPAITYVQFVDGDCELAPTWLERAVAVLEARLEVAIVCGRLRERCRTDSIYNRLCDLEWDGQTGEVAECGGIAMHRAECFQAVGGFDSTVPAGEEPELCRRLRARGWRIVRTADEMAWHDAEMRRFGQWWRRSMRSGYGALDVTARFGLPQYARQVRSAQMWALGCTAALVAGAVLALLGQRPSLGAALVVLGLLAPGLQMLRLARRALRRTSEPRTAAAYGLFTVLGKWPQALAHYRYLYDRVRGRRPAVTEHKVPAR